MGMEERYMRQLMLPQIGQGGQARIASARVLVLGAGGLGCPALQYLCAAGVGHVCLVDEDVVSLSNLNRQTLYTDADLGHSKATRAQQRLQALNSTIEIVAKVETIGEHNAEQLVVGYDVVLLCLDNAPTRYIVNRACVKRGITMVEGGVEGMYGTLMTILPHHTPCYACVKKTLPAADRPKPVLGAMAGVMGSLMALRALALIIGDKQAQQGGILTVDGVTLLSSFWPLERDERCPVCGQEI